MKKLLQILFTLLLTSYFLLLTSFAFAANDTQPPVIALVDFPEYINNRNPEISYTALDIGDAGLRDVTLEVQKEGGSWQTIGVYTEQSRKVTIDSSKINSDGKYFFQATACDNNNNCATDGTSTTIDTVSPPKPEGYSKEKTGTQTYKIKWHNPDSDDLDKVYIYRSENQNFDLNSGSEIAQVSVTKNTDFDYTDWVVPDGTKTYYYVLRSVDKAKNASDPVGDTYTTIIVVSPSPGTVSEEQARVVAPGVVVTGQQPIMPAAGQPGQVLGEKEPESTASASPQILGLQESSPLATPSSLLNLLKIPREFIIGSVALVLLIIFWLRRRQSAN